MKKLFSAIVNGQLVGTFTANLKRVIKGNAKRLVADLQFIEGEETDSTNSRFDLALQKEGNSETGEGYVFTATANNGKKGKNKKTGTVTFTTTSFNSGSFELALAGASAVAQTTQPALSEDVLKQALEANNGQLEGKVTDKWPEDFVNAQRNQVPLTMKLNGPNNEELGQVTFPKLEKGDEMGSFTGKTETAEFTFTIDGENVRYVAVAGVAAGSH